MIDLDEERFRLTISLDEAITFALGMSDLRYHARKMNCDNSSDWSR